jgi:hypothetical protein
MKIVYNIIFYYNEERIKYLLKIINEIKKYKYETDIYIHTNIHFQLKNLVSYKNKLEIIVHDLTKINPFKLTYLGKLYMKKFIKNYDIFIYSEDDILIYNEALNYWLEYKDICFEHKYNLGFLRIEYFDEDNIYLTDISSCFHEPKFVTLNNNKFLVNDKNPYCACWIYDKKRMKDYIKSKYFNSVQLMNPNNNKKIEIRESQAFGLHYKNIDYFKHTLIHVNKTNELNKINENCFIHHMPNNYINNKKSRYGKLKTNKII